MSSKNNNITTKDLHLLNRATGVVADPVKGSENYFKLERLGLVRVVNSFNPEHYKAGFSAPVKVYTLTEKGAEVLAGPLLCDIKE